MILTGNVKETKEYERCDAAPYASHCIRVVDFGTRQHEIFKNKKTGLPEEVTEIEFTFELSELMEDGKPFVVAKTFGKWLSPTSKLTKFLTSWRGTPFTTEDFAAFDINNVLGKTAMLNVTKNPTKKDPNKFYNSVDTIMPLPKGMKAIDQVNESMIFDLAVDLNDETKLKMLWPMQRKYIELSHQWKKFYGDKTVKDVIETMIQNDPQSAPMTEDINDGDSEVPF